MSDWENHPPGTAARLAKLEYALRCKKYLDDMGEAMKGPPPVTCVETCRNYEEDCPDSLAELKAAHAEGKVIQTQTHNGSTWYDVQFPAWIWGDQYRIKDPYAELKAAHAEGKTVQTRTQRGKWEDVHTPMWFDDQYYRIKD